MGAFGIKPDVLINFLSNEPPFRNSTTLKIPQSLLCGGSLPFPYQAHRYHVHLSYKFPVPIKVWKGTVKAMIIVVGVRRIW
jgi:hypothetical protein